MGAVGAAAGATDDTSAGALRGGVREGERVDVRERRMWRAA